MPAGISWPKYISFMLSSMLSMFVGAQLVHNIYNPLQDLHVYVEKEKERIRAANRQKFQE